MRSLIKSKKAAIELSIGTIVVIVLAMSMLILGIVLIRNIFVGATYNVDTLNENVESEINKLFNDKGGRIQVYLPNLEAEVSKEESFGVAFGIRNDLRGDGASERFNYRVFASSIEEGCRLTLAQADTYLSLGKANSVSISPGGEPEYRIVKIQPASSAPLCEIQYDIEVKQGEEIYDTAFFIVKIV